MLLNSLGQAYVVVFGGSGLLCLLAVGRARQFDDPEVRRGLGWLLATTGAWALLKAAYLLLPEAYQRPTYVVGLVVGFATVWPWLYFCSAYTGHDYHTNTTLRRLAALVYLALVSVKFTNPIHGAYFSTRTAVTPFAYTAIEHGVLHWTATGLSYVLSAVGLFLLFQFYFESGYDTRSLTGLTTLLGIPVVLDVAAQFTPYLLEVIYAPLGVAGFAIGVLFVAERRFVAVGRSTDAPGRSIYLDERGRIRGASTGATETFPALEDAAGDRLSDVLPDVASTIGSDEQIVERGHDEATRYYFVSDSTVDLGDASARVIHLSDVTQTERQRRALAERERELDEQNEFYRAVIDASFAFVFRIDLQGRFTFVSPSVETFLGYEPSTLQDQPISKVHPDEATTERAWNQIEPVLAGETNSVQDFPLETASGTTVYVDVRAVPIYEGTLAEDERTPDDITEIQLTVRDATERRQREGFISVTNRILRHNIRNKLTVVSGYAEILESSLSGDDQAKASDIKASADQLLELSESAQQIDELREPSTDLEPLDIVPVVERTVSQLRMQYPEASVSVDAPDAAVARTEAHVETALWELLDNAAKHGDDPPTAAVAVTVTEKQVVIQVTDDGPGLPEVERKALQSNTETQLVHGQGLGLWLVYWIVTSLQGDVEATPSPDGTTMTVRLPRAT